MKKTKKSPQVTAWIGANSEYWNQSWTTFLPIYSTLFWKSVSSLVYNHVDGKFESMSIFVIVLWNSSVCEKWTNHQMEIQFLWLWLPILFSRDIGTSIWVQTKKLGTNTISSTILECLGVEFVSSDKLFVTPYEKSQRDLFISTEH